MLVRGTRAHDTLAPYDRGLARAARATWRPFRICQIDRAVEGFNGGKSDASRVQGIPSSAGLPKGFGRAREIRINAGERYPVGMDRVPGCFNIALVDQLFDPAGAP